MFANRPGVSTLFAQYHDPEQASLSFSGDLMLFLVNCNARKGKFAV
jgi:hypothetical protein